MSKTRRRSFDLAGTLCYQGAMTDRSENNQPAETPEGERIAKVMARAGLCSRRDAERWITDGRVSVNGKVLESPAFNVTEQDQVTVDGRPIARRERTRLFMFHKPRGTVTTDHDPEGRDTIFDVLPEGLPRLVTIGRLDINTEGLLLLTNDGGLARALELPATGWLRRYRVRAHGEIDQAQLDALAAGVVIEGIEYRGIEAKIDRVQGANVWLTMGLREGKNREIKRVLEHLGLAVNRLIRVSYGPFQLGDLEDGAIEEVKTRILKDQLGEKLAAEAGVDFEAPVLDAKDREKIARRHPNDERPAVRERPAMRERPAREREPRGGEGFQRRPSNGKPREERDERPLSARDIIPRTRKHVSVMRAEKAEAGEGRRKIQRGETADRRGRTVPVERVSGGERDATRVDSRNARRFSKERDGGRSAERPASGPRAGWRRSEEGGGRPRRDDRGSSTNRAAGEGRADGGRRPWEQRGDSRRTPEASGERRESRPRPEGGERPERTFRSDRGPRKDFGDRPPRKDFGERAPRKDFGDRPPRKDFGDRGPRKDLGDRGPRKDFGDRPPRKDFGDRPPRKPFGERPDARADRPDRKRDDRPGRSFGDKPGGRDRFAGKSDGEGARKGPGGRGGFKSPGGKGPGGKGPGGFGKGPGGKGPGGRAGGRPGGGRPSGGRPAGGRPGGSRPPR
jgi:23S rRNA pseudouridine2605 synthase